MDKPNQRLSQGAVMCWTGRSAASRGRAAGSISFVAAMEKLRLGADTADAVRVRRLREDARRPLSVNLAEGIALSHKLMRFTGAARKA